MVISGSGNGIGRRATRASMRRLWNSRVFSCFLFLGVFAVAGVFVVADEALKNDSSRTSIRTRVESQRTRCLMVSDDDELGLLSKARPLTARPWGAVTRTRDGAVCNKICSAFLRYCWGERVRRWLAEPPTEETVQNSFGYATC
jgi:hypothetical protein